ncbi:hypothetical protein R80B4_01498 [Fibrobacteres bacterium R8-0-B4]
MTPEERNEYMSKEYGEAVRYMDNAQETLKRAGKHNDGYYKDEKYVRTACGTAYLGVLIALDAWLTLKGVDIPIKNDHTNIKFYLTNIGKLDMKLLDRLNAAYHALHLAGYYRKVKSVSIIKGGFDAAYEIIGKIKPADPRTASRRPAAARAGFDKLSRRGR